ncbi:heparan-alpha-glucosaminide N-acetyltransferase-like [Branchiostoma lanceolatum]|uniref:heparan-alpha-glucosaminide N-acetyltransferase-like n=1 Tax=Branchiostoma lanceolatum TaxID=7740 RepID=UPI003456613E
MDDLARDTALLHVINAFPTAVDILLQSSDCHQCRLVPVASVSEGSSSDVITDTVYPVNVAAVEQNTSRLLCRRPWFTKLAFWRKDNDDTEGGRSSQDVEMQSNPTAEREQRPTAKKERLRSLDTFRGLCLTIMLFVNFGGGGYWIFQHPTWNGLTIADTVFPWFVFIMGTSMGLSFRSMRKRTSTRGVVFRVIIRSVKLFVVGFFLNAGHGRNDLATVRVPGVLQRFSIAYLVTGLIECFVGKDGKPSDAQSRLTNPTLQKIHNALRDVLDNWAPWILHLLILIMHLIITFLLPVPGCPTGYLGPGGPLLGDGAEYLNCTGGAAGYIDRLMLGSHMYQTPTVRVLYKTQVAFDPEGILGSLTTIFNCFLGLQAGKILVHYKDHGSRVGRWVIWAVLAGVLATLLCKGTKNDGWIPVNKNLWSLSYVLALCSMAYVLLALCYLVVDVKKWWSGWPFYCCGMNSILLYAGQNILYDYFPFYWRGVPLTHPHLLTMHLVGTTLWVIIAVYLHHVKFYVKI